MTTHQQPQPRRFRRLAPAALIVIWVAVVGLSLSTISTTHTAPGTILGDAVAKNDGGFIGVKLIEPQVVTP